MEPRFYWPDNDSTIGLLRAKCPHSTCCYVGYFAVWEKETITDLHEDTIIGNCMMRMYAEHPLHFCSVCMTWHKERGANDKRCRPVDRTE
jgi:hypothetical protein